MRVERVSVSVKAEQVHSLVLGPQEKRGAWHPWSRLAWQNCPALQRLWSDFHEQKSDNRATAATPRRFSKGRVARSASVLC